MDLSIYAQGDCLLIQDKIPATANEPVNNPVLLTGESHHKHQLADGASFVGLEKLKEKKYEILKDPNSNVIYLRVFRPSDLVHEEHDKITIPPGEYRLGQVRERGLFDDLIAPVLD
jgi:hypothetical protein